MRLLTVVDYDRQWPDVFEAEHALLLTTLGDVARCIHHIGSTSVTGLAAKPVIDMLIEVSTLAELDRLNAAMESNGYRARGENGIRNRRYFTKGSPQRSHQIHAFPIGDAEIIRHLAFRDYLRENKEIAAHYADIKRAALKACGNDAQRYSALKAGFIQHHLQLALSRS